MSIRIPKTILPGETAAMCLYELMQQVMPNLSDNACKHLLIHQFLFGLATSMSFQLQAAVNTTNLKQVIATAKVLMVVDNKKVNCCNYIAKP